MLEESRLMEKHPGIYGNTHKFYDSTSHETHQAWMDKVKFAYDNLDRKRYFGYVISTRVGWAAWHFG